MKTALVVDDEPTVLSVVVAVLRRRGYQVVYTSKPEDAILLCEAGSTPDLLVSDAIMPNMNARRLLGRLRQILPNLAVVVISGWDRDTLVEQGAISPTDEFLKKPFIPDQLYEAIDRVIERTDSAHS